MNEIESKHPRHGGRILKEAREAQGISLDTVHAATKIPMDALKSIEEGYKVRTLTPFYVKGFMKMYAHYLNVDIRKVMEDYHPEQLPPHIPDEDKGHPLERIAVRISKEQQKLIAEILGALILLFIVFKIVAVIWMGKAHKGNVKPPGTAAEKKKAVAPRRPSASVPGQKAAPASETRTKAPKPVAGVAETSTDEEKKPAPAAKKIRLTIRAKKSGWLQVKADGNIVFQSTLEEGASENWNAEKMIELSGKNIHNLEFELNGKVLGGLGREDRSARRVIVTAEGLSVKSTL